MYFPQLSEIDLADPLFAEHYSDLGDDEEGGSDFENDFYEEYLKYDGRCAECPTRDSFFGKYRGFAF